MKTKDFCFDDIKEISFRYEKQIFPDLESKNPMGDEERDAFYNLLLDFWKTIYIFLQEFSNHLLNQLQQYGEKPFAESEFLKTGHNNEIRFVLYCLTPIFNRLSVKDAEARIHGVNSLTIRDRDFLKSREHSIDLLRKTVIGFRKNCEILKSEMEPLSSGAPLGDLLSLLPYRHESEKEKAIERIYNKNKMPIHKERWNQLFSFQDIDEKHPDQIDNIIKASIAQLPHAHIKKSELGKTSKIDKTFQKDEPKKPIKDHALSKLLKIPAPQFEVVLKRRLARLVEKGMPGVKWHIEEARREAPKKLGHDRIWEDSEKPAENHKETQFYKYKIPEVDEKQVETNNDEDQAEIDNDVPVAMDGKRPLLTNLNQSELEDNTEENTKNINHKLEERVIKLGVKLSKGDKRIFRAVFSKQNISDEASQKALKRLLKKLDKK